METKCFSFSKDWNIHGTTNSGSLCIQALPLTSTMHCLETRPGQYSKGCVPTSLEQGIRFLSSSIQLDNLGSKEDPRRKERQSNHSDTHMASSALICTDSENVCRATISSASFKKCVSKSAGKKLPSSRNNVTEISGVVDFWESLQMEGISRNAAKLISNSRTKNIQLQIGFGTVE